MPDQTFDTIGDRFSEKGLDWAWYSGGWNDAQLGGDAASPDVIDQFQYHHQPFVYFAKYADGTAAKAAHLKDEQDFLALAKTGALPSVSFIKPMGIDNEHPGYTDVLRGDQHARCSSRPCRTARPGRTPRSSSPMTSTADSRIRSRRPRSTVGRSPSSVSPSSGPHECGLDGRLLSRSGLDQLRSEVENH